MSYTLVPCPPRTLYRQGYRRYPSHPLPRLLTRSSPWQLMSDRHLSGRESIHRLFPRREHQNRQARTECTDGGGKRGYSRRVQREIQNWRVIRKKNGNPNTPQDLPRNSSGPDHKAFSFPHGIFLSFLFFPLRGVSRPIWIPRV